MQEYLTITLSRSGRVTWIEDVSVHAPKGINELCAQEGWQIMAQHYVPSEGDMVDGEWVCLLSRPIKVLRPYERFLHDYPVYVTEQPLEADEHE